MSVFVSIKKTKLGYWTIQVFWRVLLNLEQISRDASQNIEISQISNDTLVFENKKTFCSIADICHNWQMLEYILFKYVPETFSVTESLFTGYFTRSRDHWCTNIGNTLLKTHTCKYSSSSSLFLPLLRYLQLDYKIASMAIPREN